MINLFIGPEGSGKTLLMTKQALGFAGNGGTVYGFPGYRVVDGNGDPVSKDMDLEDWITLPPELKDTMICIDEMNNFFDAYRYNSVMTRLFGSLAQQRRKRNLHICGTVQDYEWLPPRLRWLIHVVTSCYDLHWKYHKIKRGHMIVIRHCDMKGFIAGKPGRWFRPLLLQGAQKYWKFYDSYEVVDVINQFTQVRIHGAQVDLYRGNQPGSGDDGPSLPPITDDNYEVPLDFRQEMGYGRDIVTLPVE